jgi:hypothetical protein
MLEARLVRITEYGTVCGDGRTSMAWKGWLNEWAARRWILNMLSRVENWSMGASYKFSPCPHDIPFLGVRLYHRKPIPSTFNSINIQQSMCSSLLQIHQLPDLWN